MEVELMRIVEVVSTKVAIFFHECVGLYDKHKLHTCIDREDILTSSHTIVLCMTSNKHVSSV